MNITIIENDERDYAKMMELLELISSDAEYAPKSSSQRGIGDVLATFSNKTGLTKLFEGIKKLFSRNEVFFEYSEGDQKFSLYVKGQDVNVERLIAFVTDSRIEISEEEKRIERFEKPFEIECKIGKK